METPRELSTQRSAASVLRNTEPETAAARREEFFYTEVRHIGMVGRADEVFFDDAQNDGARAARACSR
jgi:hypothetical protein